MPRPHATRTATRIASAALLLAILQAGPGGVAPLRAQEAAPPDTVVAAAGGVSPRGAFLRAIALPGWGHASISSYNRGGLYFAAETASWWMFARSRSRLFEARRRIEIREAFLREGAALDGIQDPVAIQEFLEADETLADLRGLEESRRQQREDWAALGIFLILLSGADAYVSAHLKDFPTPIELSGQPLGDGRWELSVGVRLPR